MNLSRRTLARMLAAAAATPVSAAAQSDSSADPDLESARERMADEAKQLAGILIPKMTAPACQFRA